MTKAERTQQLIAEKTAPLFNCKGFEGTSLSDLTKATGLTKGALYGNYDDKEDIAVAAFQYSMRKVRAMVKKDLAGSITYKQQLLALLNFYSRYVFNPPVKGGCPLLNTAIEADDHRHSMRRMVSRELVNTVEFIAMLIRKGIRAGEFKKTANPRKLAFTFFCSIEGALMFSRVEKSHEAMDIIVDHCKKQLDLISK